MDSEGKFYDDNVLKGIKTQLDCESKCLDIGDNADLVGYSFLADDEWCVCYFTDNSITDIDFVGDGYTGHSVKGPVDHADPNAPSGLECFQNPKFVSHPLRLHRPLA